MQFGRVDRTTAIIITIAHALECIEVLAGGFGIPLTAFVDGCVAIVHNQHGLSIREINILVPSEV